MNNNKKKRIINDSNFFLCLFIKGNGVWLGVKKNFLLIRGYTAFPQQAAGNFCID